MKKLKYKFIVVIILLLTDANGSFSQSVEIAEIFNRLSEVEHGRFLLKGNVVDQDGNELHDVSLRLEKV